MPSISGEADYSIRNAFSSAATTTQVVNGLRVLSHILPHKDYANPSIIARTVKIALGDGSEIARQEANNALVCLIRQHPECTPAILKELDDKGANPRTPDTRPYFREAAQASLGVLLRHCPALVPDILPYARDALLDDSRRVQNAGLRNIRLIGDLYPEFKPAAEDAVRLYTAASRTRESSLRTARRYGLH
ncbi:MAG: hypothetical protein WDO70_08500 [Alphaproteobacteria bacterium]